LPKNELKNGGYYFCQAFLLTWEAECESERKGRALQIKLLNKFCKTGGNMVEKFNSGAKNKKRTFDFIC